MKVYVTELKIIDHSTQHCHVVPVNVCVCVALVRGIYNKVKIAYHCHDNATRASDQ
jgi:hypothetical protein